MDNYISVLSIAVIIVVVVLTYYFNKKENREHNLFMEKFRIYSAYLQIISDASTKNSKVQTKEGLLNRLIQIKQEIILFTPNEVVSLIGEIEPIDFTTRNQTEKERDKKYELYLELLNLMRKDLSKNNKEVSQGTLEKLLGRN